LVLSACASERHSGRATRQGASQTPQREAEFHPPNVMLMRYDFNHDGSITRAEMEAGLKADFDAADTNHDGRLDEDEVRAVNRQRLNMDPTASPLIDWNHDGYVDFDEFAAEPRSLFEQLDTNADGVLSPTELNPRGVPGKPADQSGTQSGQGQGHGRGRHRGGGGQGGGQGGDPGNGQ
jgi:hypothetical protein